MYIHDAQVNIAAVISFFFRAVVCQRHKAKAASFDYLDARLGTHVRVHSTPIIDAKTCLSVDKFLRSINWNRSVTILRSSFAGEIQVMKRYIAVRVYRLTN